MSATYLRVAGRLRDDNQIELRLRGLVETPSSPPPRSSPVTAEVFDAEKNLIMRHQVSVSRLCVYPDADDGVTLSCRLPLRDDAVLVRLSRDGVKLCEFPVERARLEIALQWAPGNRVAGRQQIKWAGRHPDGKALRYCVRYRTSELGAWRPVGLATDTHELDVDFAELPGGERCQISVTATDGINVAAAESDWFSVAVKPCKVVIGSPHDAARIRAGESSTLRGYAYYLEEMHPEVDHFVWTSSIDGEIGRAATVSVALSPGRHELVLCAGKGERVGRARVMVDVGGSTEDSVA
jgi:hypothetical protein